MPEITVQELATVKGVSRRAVYDALARGRIKRLPNGKLDQETALNDWTENTSLSKGGKRPRQKEEASKSPKLDNPAIGLLTTFFWQLQEQCVYSTSIYLMLAGASAEQSASFVTEKLMVDAALAGELLGLENEAWIDRNCAVLRLTRDQKALAKQIKAWWKDQA